jgi:deoxycytidylate deaminase
MYSTWIPCPVCANAIINSGIDKVVFHYESAVKSHKEWENDLKESLKLMLEAGVELETYKGKIGNVEGLFNKKKWEP